MFKGSAHVGPDEHSRIIEAVGGFDNAETNDDTTNFFETFPSNYLERVLWLEADRMGSLNVDDANFKSERQVVEEERRVRVDNQPYGTIEEDLARRRLHGARLPPHAHRQHRGSGQGHARRTFATFFNTYYKPNNATLVHRRRFQFRPGARLDQEIFRGHSRFRQARFRGPTRPSRRKPRSATSKSPIRIRRCPPSSSATKFPRAMHPDSYPLDLASNILAGGESSRLYQSLVYKDQIAVQAAGFGNFTEDPNLFWAYAIMNPGHTPEEGEKAVVAILDGLKTSRSTPRNCRKPRIRKFRDSFSAATRMRKKPWRWQTPP